MISKSKQMYHIGSFWKIVLPGLAFAASVLASLEGQSISGISYNRDIRPVLSENCFTCHGTDSAARKAGLRLDQAQVATNKLENGTVAIVPGQPEKSEMIRRIFLNDDDQMPPAKVNKVLKPEQK